MTCVLYLLHVKSILIPVFTSSYNLFSYFSCKVTTGTYNLQSVLLNFKSFGLLIGSTAGYVAGLSPSAIGFLVAFPVNTQS